MTPPGWLVPALPFIAAFAAQLLATVTRLAASSFSTKYFEALEKKLYVADADSRKRPKNRNPQEGLAILPSEYHSDSIGKVYAKNGDGAALFTGSVTLLITWLNTGLATGLLSSVIVALVLAFGLFAGVRLWRMPADKYAPRPMAGGVSLSVGILLVLFLAAGAAMAILTELKIIP